LLILDLNQWLSCYYIQLSHLPTKYLKFSFPPNNSSNFPKSHSDSNWECDSWYQSSKITVELKFWLQEIKIQVYLLIYSYQYLLTLLLAHLPPLHSPPRLMLKSTARRPTTNRHAAVLLQHCTVTKAFGTNRNLGKVQLLAPCFVGNNHYTSSNPVL
jgi:hypothetical protein